MRKEISDFGIKSKNLKIKYEIESTETIFEFLKKITKTYSAKCSVTSSFVYNVSIQIQSNCP